MLERAAFVGVEEIRAELPMLRRLGKDLRMANWKASVTLEMRDWVCESDNEQPAYGCAFLVRRARRPR